MTAPIAAEASSPQPATGSVADVARSALTALIDLLPRALWRAFKGGLSGSLVLGLTGLALAGLVAAADARGILTIPRWLLITNLLWVPFIFSLAGGYAGSLNGLLSTIAEEVESRGLAARLYAVLKPACLAVVKRARGDQATPLSRALRSALEQGLSQTAPPRPQTFSERAEIYLATRSRRLLCLSALGVLATAPDRDSALLGLESLSVRQLARVLSDTLEDLFSMHITIAAALALVAASAPTLVHLALR